MRSLAALALILVCAAPALAAIEAPAHLDAASGRFKDAQGAQFTVRSAFYNQPAAHTGRVLSDMDLGLLAADLELLRQDGFNALSLIVPWAEVLPDIARDNQGNYQYDSANLDKLEDLLDAAADADLYVILSLCTADRLPAGVTGADFTAATRLTDPDERAAWIDSAAGVAGRLADHPALLLLYAGYEAVGLARWDYVLAEPANLDSFRAWLFERNPSARYWLERWGEPAPGCDDQQDSECWSYVALPAPQSYAGSPWGFDPAWDKIALFHEWQRGLLIELIDELAAAVNATAPRTALGFLGRSSIVECDPNPNYDATQDPDADWLPLSALSRGRHKPNPGDDPGVYCREILDDSELYAALAGLGYDLAAWGYFPQRAIEQFHGDRPPLDKQLAEFTATAQWLDERTTLPLFCEELGARSLRDTPDGGRSELLQAYAAALELPRSIGAALWTWRDDGHISGGLNRNALFRLLDAQGAPQELALVGRPALTPIVGANAAGQPLPVPLALVDFDDYYAHSVDVAPGARLCVEITLFGTDATGSTLLAEIAWLDADGALLGSWSHSWTDVGIGLSALSAISDPAPAGSSLAVLSARPAAGDRPLALVAAVLMLPYSDWGLRDLESAAKPVLSDPNAASDIRRINASHP